MTSKTSPPYAPIYPKDELATISLLDLEVVGVYYRLKWHLWISGGKTQNDEKILCRMAGIHLNKWRKLRPKLDGLLVEYDDGTISLLGVVESYEKAAHKRRVLQENGAKGGRPKKDAQGAENQENGKANGFDSQKPDGFSNEKQNGASFGSDLQKHSSSSPTHNQLKKIDDDPGGYVDNSRRRGSTNGFQSLGNLIGHFEDDSLLKVRQVFNENGLHPPPDWHVLNQWIQFGADMERDILPVLQQVCARVAQKGVSPPKSFNYFEDAVTRQINKHAGNF